MPAAAIPADEAERLAVLNSYALLDRACETAFDNIAHLAARLTGAAISFVSLVDAKEMVAKGRHGLEVERLPRELAFCAHAILDPSGPLVVPDLGSDRRFADNPLVLGEPHLRFYAGAPLVSPEGAALGTLCVMDDAPRDLPAEMREALVRLAETAMTTMELRRAMGTARTLALTDALTGLGNRAALIGEVEASLARLRLGGRSFGLVYLDLDGFKGVNDRLGHATGDAVLRGVAEALRETVRRGDVACRLGGDEFAVVVEGWADLPAIGARLRESIGGAMASRGWPVTASIGAVQFHEAPSGVDATLRAADEAMYAAKRAGKDRVTCREFGDARGSAAA